MSLVDIYGFDFDGATRIESYINPTLNTTNTEISFDFKKQIDSDSYIYGSDLLSIGFDATEKLYFELSLDVDFYLTSLNVIETNEVIKVKIVLSKTGNDLTIEMYINEVLQSSQTETSIIESFEFSLDSSGLIGVKSEMSSDEYENDFIFGGIRGSGINEFNAPRGININGDKIYIADSGNDRIVITELDGTWITSFGSNGSGINEFNDPFGINVYSDKIYIADTGNNKIVITELDGTWITSFGTSGSGINEFYYPASIDVYGDKIYLCDTGNNRIVITELDGTWITSFGAQGNGINEFRFQYGINVYGDKIYIADTSNHRIVITELDGTWITSIGTQGSGLNEFYYPTSIDVYGDKIYIVDSYNNRIVITELDGTWITSFGSNGSGINEFNDPFGINVYSDKIYIADTGNNRISIWSIITGGIIYIGYSNSILANFVVESSGAEVFNESFNNTTLGTITGTEQYAIIGQKDDGSLPYSTLNLYIKPFKYNTDFVQKNKTVSGYNSIAPWKFSSELENRLQDDYVQITTNDIMFINKIKSASNTTQTHKNNFNLHIYSYVVGSLDVYGIYESSNEVIATFDVVTGDNYLTVDLNNVNSLEKLGFILPSIDFRLYLDSDIEIECFETGVQVDVEGINVSVEPSIKSYITLDDSIFTNKIKNPLYSYSSDLILTHAEFEQLADFIDISNLYKRRVMVNIDVNETIGNRTAGIPDISNTDFTFASLQTSETTGLYKYVTISYFNSENNKVR